MPPRDEVVDYIPNEGFFRHYHEMTKETEVCPRFHFFVGAAIIGSIVNRKVSFQRSGAEIFPTLFPNPWIVLVAPQGVGHKTAALSVGRKLLIKLPVQSQPRILSAKITPEALVKNLAAQTINIDPKTLPANINPNYLRPSATGLLYSTEIGVLLGREKYNTGMISLLTELYDCHDEWSSETVMRGDQRLYNVCLSLLGASTPDWMQSMLPSDAFKGGFMSRLLLISMPVGWERRRVADPPRPDPQHRAYLLQDLERMSHVSGAYTWTKEAKAYFEDWYMSVERDSVVGPVAAYHERKQDHMLRLAMVLQMTLSQQLELTKEVLVRSLSILNTVEKETSPMVEYVATEPRMRSAQYILEVLRNTPQGMSEAKLLSTIWRSLSHPREFEEVMRMLLTAKAVRMEFKGGENVYVKVEPK